MNKIPYDKVTIDDNWVLVAQALTDKQAEIVEWINGLCDVGKNSPLCKDKW